MRDAVSPPAIDDAVVRLLEGPDAASADMMLARLPKASTARLEVRAGLASEAMYRRLCALARVVIEVGYGIYPEFADQLGSAMLDQWPKIIAGLRDCSEKARWTLLGSVTDGTVRARYTRGDFGGAIALTDRWLDEASRTHVPNSWVNGHAIKAEALIRQLKIAEAKRVLSRFTPAERASVRTIATAEKMMENYEIAPLLPASTFNYDVAINTIVSRDLPDIEQTTAAWKQSLLTLENTSEARERLETEFLGLIQEKDKIEALSKRRDLSAPIQYEALMRALMAFQDKARDLLTSGSRSNQLDILKVAELINYGATIHSFATPRPDEIQAALGGLRSAIPWCRERDDRHNGLVARRVLAMLLKKSGDDRGAYRANKQLYEELRGFRAGVEPLETRTSFSGPFRRLAPELLVAAEQFDEPNVAFSAIEFRRGLLLSEPRRPKTWTAPDPYDAPLPAELLGARTHYLGLSAFDEQEPIVATLYCASGEIRAERLNIVPATVRQVSTRIDPTIWNRPRWFGKTEDSTVDVLSPLLDPLRQALSDQLMAAGDHVCLAVDDPVHAAPLHYLVLQGAPAVATFSFSRVASLADARLVYESPVARPSRVAAAYIPVENEMAVAAKQAAFQALAGQITADRVLLGAEATVPGLCALMTEHDLVHIQAHGTFPDATSTADPMQAAGLLLSDGVGLPFRTSNPRTVLSPAILANAADVAPGSHVSLCACVSGLGRRGQGGDTLGLEFALRLKGATSVLASHWHVRWTSADEFFRGFYRYWLSDKMPRSEAWRAATLDTMQQIASAPGGEATLAPSGAAFSLFGDWR